MVVCDGLKGLPAAIETVWPQAITQTCIVHLLRNSFRYASKKHWAALAKDLKPIYTAPRRIGRPGCVRRPHRGVGRPLPGGDQALEQRLERVHPVLGLRRPLQN